MSVAIYGKKCPNIINNIYLEQMNQFCLKKMNTVYLEQMNKV